MPQLNHLDDYEKCFETKPDQLSLYCYIDTTIVPNKSNEVWNIIEDYSLDYKHYFRHDRLRYGLCLNYCFDIFKNSTKTEMEYLFQPLNFDRKIDYIKKTPSMYQDEKNYRQQYNKLINQCINYELKTDYDLMAFSEIFYCDTTFEKGGDIFQFDFLSYLMICIVILLISITITSTLYDYRLRKLSNLKSTKILLHYKTSPQSFKNKIFVCFSIYRNVLRLFYSPTKKELKETGKSQEIIAINTFRFSFMFGIIYTHCLAMYSATSFENGIFFEKHQQSIFSTLMINGQIALQTYFTITGFLVAFKFLQLIEKSNQQKQKIKLAHYFMVLLFRYLRLFPVYAFMVLLNTSWVIYAQNGPLWRYIVEMERANCRNSWWTNLLFINNYFGTTNPCMQHTWYLATDIQLSALALICFWLISNYPGTKKTIFVLSVSVSYIIPGAITYFNAYEGVILNIPQTYQYLLIYSPMYKTVHIPTHINTGPFVNGVLGGWLWYYLKRESFDFSRFKCFNVAWPLFISLGPLYIISGFIFYEYDFEKPSLWIAVYAAISKNFWGYFMSLFIICFTSGVGGVLRDIAVQKLYNVLGRITFCAYLVHLMILQTTMANLRRPYYLTKLTITLDVISNYVLTYLAGGLLCLFIEMPCANLLRLLVDKITPKPDSLITKTTKDGVGSEQNVI